MLKAAEKPLIFDSFDSMKGTLHVEDKGHYYICDCPHCHHHEAFIYKKSPFMITCNRQNHCGAKVTVSFKNKEDVQKIQKMKYQFEKPMFDFSMKHAEQLLWLKQFLKYEKRYKQATHLDNFRGLSHETTESFIIDLKNEETVRYMFEKIPDLCHKNYAGISSMTKRNIIMPILNQQGDIDSLLLRTTLDPNEKKKEIQLMMRPGGQNFFIDIPAKAKRIVFTESLIDGLSFREIDPQIGLVGLSGSRKTRQVVNLIKKNPQLFNNKLNVLALDNDLAGKEAREKILKGLKETQCPTVDFQYEDGVKDPNEFLQMDRFRFEDALKRTLKNDNDQKKNLRTDPKMDLDVKINHLTPFKEGTKAIAAVQYGELTLNNIMVEEHKGSVFVNFPKIKGTDGQYRDVYQFSNRPGYDFDKRAIEGALIQNYYALKYGAKKEVKNVEVPVKFNRDYEPIILHDFAFENGNHALNLAYRSLTVNQVVVGKSKQGRDYVGLPFYKTKENETKSFVIASKVFREKVLKKTQDQILTHDKTVEKGTVRERA